MTNFLGITTRFIVTAELTSYEEILLNSVSWRAEHPACWIPQQTASPQKCIEQHSDGRTT
ncbi:hypothetical protein EXN66_Car011303 [Channa argus]|uniref:Uncharacterized protein n=1 Tax=Channa argus TaxID=215402 RepID=A0A6G1PZF0_CHAAH|nr:hypothetical protein EXN66_Car011303 [Channa argus]